MYALEGLSVLDMSVLSETVGAKTSARRQTKPEEGKLYRYGRPCMMVSGCECISKTNAGLACDIIRQDPEYVTPNKVMQYFEPYAARYHTVTNHASDKMILVLHTSNHTTGGVLITYNDSQD